MKKSIYLQKMLMVMFLGVFMFAGAGDATGQAFKLPGNKAGGGDGSLYCIGTYAPVLKISIYNQYCGVNNESPEECTDMKVTGVSFNGFTPTNNPLNNVDPILNPYETIELSFQFSNSDWVDIINNHSVIDPLDGATVITLGVTITYQKNLNYGARGTVWSRPINVYGQPKWRFCDTSNPPFSGLRMSNADDVESIETLAVSPNPTNDNINVEYDLKGKSTINLTLFNVLGQQVKSIVQHEVQEEGEYEEAISLTDLDKGIYYLVLKVGDELKTEKIVKL